MYKYSSSTRGGYLHYHLNSMVHLVVNLAITQPAIPRHRVRRKLYHPLLEGLNFLIIFILILVDLQVHRSSLTLMSIRQRYTHPSRFLRIRQIQIER